MLNAQRLVFCVPTSGKGLIMASKRWKGATRVTQRQFETTDEYVCFLRAFKKRDWSFIFSGVFVIICQLEGGGGSKENHYERKGGFARNHSC